MKEVFEKIIEKLEEEYLQAEKDMGLSDTYDEASHCGGRAAAYEKAQKIVKQEAEQYNNGWIPCSERLPNQDGEFTDVLITCESIADGVFVQSAEFYIAADGEPIFDALYHYERVFAWQPLPQPYQPKGE